MALGWIPLTSHAWLESHGVIHAADDDHDGDHEAADGHVLLEQNSPSTMAPTFVALPWLAIVPDLIAEVYRLAEPPVHQQLYRSTAPPEVQRMRHFTERAALPSRAPSLAS
jgi:hypothetical protein